MTAPIADGVQLATGLHEIPAHLSRRNQGLEEWLAGTVVVVERHRA